MSYNPNNPNGQALMADSAPVVIASNQTTLPVTIAAIIANTTYSASITNLNAAALATDIFTLTGSATKVVRLAFMRLTSNKTGASTTANIIVLKRSTANTGGTSTTPTKVSNDSTNPAATATVLAYTANPTLGALVGQIRSRKAFINTTGSGPSDVVEWNFRSDDTQQPTARGIAEVIAVNLNGVTITGNTFDISIEWTESDT